MSVKVEVAELMEKDGLLYDISEKVTYKQNLNTEEKEVAEVVDAWAKEIGNTGKDYEHEIAAYIQRVIAPEVYDKPDELLSLMFNRGTVGEFDDVRVVETPKNTLRAYNAAKGGNVRKSYIDSRAFTPTWKHKQVESSITYADLRRNGFKSIATLTTYANEAFKNAMIADVFNALDAGITGQDQIFAVTGAAPTAATLNQLALYVIDQADDGDTPFMFSLNKYAQGIANISGYTSFMSDAMKDEFNRYGLIREYAGVLIAGFSGAKKAADGATLVPDKRIFGVAGKIGDLDMRGELRVYETMDNNQEKVDLKLTGFEFGTVIYKPEKVGKVTFSQ